MKSVFQYIDYRAYLLDYFEHRKKRIKQYSFRQMMSEMGFSSPGYLKLIIDKQRNLG